MLRPVLCSASSSQPPMLSSRITWGIFLRPPRRMHVAFLLSSLLVTHIRLANSDGTVANDYSQFERFEFRQQSGFWSCPLEDVPYVATIVRNGPSRYLFRDSVLEKSATESDDCIHMMSSGTCLIEHELPNRELTREEVDRLKTVFSRIVVRTSPPPKCEGQLVIDYCRTLRCRWDDHVHNDAECQKDSLVKSQIDELIMLLKEFHGRNMPPANQRT
jgi:hypothetical protein